MRCVQAPDNRTTTGTHTHSRTTHALHTDHTHRTHVQTRTAHTFTYAPHTCSRASRIHTRLHACTQSDCPHRERLGYGGDALASGESGLSIFDWRTFYRKRVMDYSDAQRPTSGAFTETAPFVGMADGGLAPGGGPMGWETYQPIAMLWLCVLCPRQRSSFVVLFTSSASYNRSLWCGASVDSRSGAVHVPHVSSGY